MHRPLCAGRPAARSSTADLRRRSPACAAFGALFTRLSTAAKALRSAGVVVNPCAPFGPTFAVFAWRNSLAAATPFARSHSREFFLSAWMLASIAGASGRRFAGFLGELMAPDASERASSLGK